jgi:ubiquinone/menaquinone biosynthesis C-methylase UbiE
VTGHGTSAAAPAPEPFTKSLERMNYFQEPEARVLLSDLELPPGSSGLDAGCGVGLYALWLAEAVGLRGRVHVAAPDPVEAAVLQPERRRIALAELEAAGVEALAHQSARRLHALRGRLDPEHAAPETHRLGEP